MAFADFDWATDTNYPAGSETWSATPTKVAPSSGAQADGFTPEDRPPAQWVNWLFNGVITAGQALELRGLQEAWDQSETNLDTTPHIDVGMQDFRVGTEGIPTLFKVDGVTNRVHIDGVLDTFTAEVSNKLTLAGVSALSITGAGAGGRPKALIQTSGVGGETNLEQGPFTPSVASVTGTGPDAETDFTSLTGRYQRLGQTVFYTMRFLLDTTGWSGACTVEFDLPVSGTISGVMHGVIDPGRPGDAGDYFTFLSVSSSAFQVNITPGSSKGSGLALNVSGSYLLA